MGSRHPYDRHDGDPIGRFVTAIAQFEWLNAGAMMVLLVLGWLVARAIPAARLAGRTGGFPESSWSTWRRISQLPRDIRLVRAGLPFATALGCYAFGALVGLVVAGVTGHLLIAALAFTPFAVLGGRLYDRARRQAWDADS